MKILYCEDHKFLRETISRFLQQIPKVSDVTAVENGKIALEKLKKETFDMVISDIRMPEMDGIELLKKINEKWPSLPVLIFSTYATNEMGEFMLEKGAWGYVSKGDDPDDLRNAVNIILDGEKYYSEELKSLMKAPTKLSKKKK